MNYQRQGTIKYFWNKIYISQNESRKKEILIG